MAENIYSFLASFKRVKQTGPDQYICCCPAHDDRTASLSIKDDTAHSGRILLSCHAGCATADILTEVGKTWSDIQPTKDEEQKPLQKWQIDLEAEYRYTDEDGNYLYSKLRYKGKRIRYGRIVGNNYTAGKGGTESELYNLSMMQSAINKGKTIYFVEGEKDVETMRSIGLIAVTAGGTEDWKCRFAKHFVGAHDVVIIADNDKPGQQLAEKVSRDLRPVVYKQRIITPSELKHGDITDYLEDEDGTKEDLFKMIDEASPVFARWVGDKGKINPSLLANAILSQDHVILVRNPGTKSDQLMWYRDGVYSTYSQNQVEAEIDKYLPAHSSNPSLLRNTAQMLMVRARVVGYDELDADESFINVRNGLIRVPEFELVAHDPNVLSSVQLKCDYDPTAKAPVWEQFKREYCKDEDGVVDEEMLRLDRMKAGIILSNIYGHRLKGAFVQYSTEGNTGKSVDCDILAQILGTENVANVSFQDMSTDRWATGRVWGKRLVVVGDQGKESIKDSSTFKELTGGDPVSAELKGLQHFTYKFRGVILVSCNHLPVFDDDKGDHMAERLNFIHSRNVIPENKRDVYLRDKLLEESSGILNWALSGLRDFIENGDRLCECKSSDALMAEYRCKYDTFFSFVYSECEITGDRSDYIAKTELEDAYFRYCTSNELTYVNKRNVKERAASQGIVLRSLHGMPVYRGVRFKGEKFKVVEGNSGFVPVEEQIPF